MKKRFLWLLPIVVGCASQDVPDENLPPDTLYKNGINAYKESSYKAAIKSFSAIEREYPYSNLATKAQIMTAYCQYLTRSYDEAAENFKLFTQLHPNHPKVAYALYMTGLCYYEQLSIVERDQSSAHDALDVFNDLVTRFSKTKYAQDARKKITILYDHMAGKRMAIGRYHQQQGNYTAAINRFKEVEENFATTAHLPESYFRNVESYIALGEEAQAKVYLNKLIKTFPTSVWTKRAQELLG